MGVVEGFARFAEELLYRSLFFNKVAGLWLAALLKGDSGGGVIPVGFARLLGVFLLRNTSG